MMRAPGLRKCHRVSSASALVSFRVSNLSSNKAQSCLRKPSFSTLTHSVHGRAHAGAQRSLRSIRSLSLRSIRSLSSKAQTVAVAPKESLFQSYTRLLHSHPVLTKALTSGCIAVVADVSCQVYTHSSSSDSSSSSSQPFTWDWGRTAKFGAINGFLFAPAVHHWYGFLGRTIAGNTVKLIRTSTAKCNVVARHLFAIIGPSGYFCSRILFVIAHRKSQALALE
jgi:hypothetical protein